jgi:type VI secretion system ImpM family protein
MATVSSGCFGKLPLAGDFLRVNAGGPEVADLDQWIQEGLSAVKAKLGPAWDRAFDASEPKRFVYVPEKAERMLVGVIVPSRDQTGRRYPMCIFLRVERQGRSESAARLPAQCATFFEAALDLARGGWADGDAKAFLARVERLADAVGDPSAGRDDLVRRWETRTVADFSTALFGEASQERISALGNALDVLLPALRASGTTLGFGLKCPLSTDDLADVAFWCEFTARLAHRDLGDPFLFWSRSVLLASYRRPSPKVWLSFLDPTHDDEWWYDLAGARTAKPFASGHVTALLEEGSRSLASLLAAAEEDP